jgi:hypothetical protein
MSQIIGDVLTLGSAGGADNTRWLLFSKNISRICSIKLSVYA